MKGRLEPAGAIWSPSPVYSLSGPTFPSPVAIAGTAYTGPGGLLVCKLWVFQSDLLNTSAILHLQGSASNDFFDDCS